MIPPLAPYPPDHVRRTLPPDEWSSVQNLYAAALEVRLRLDDAEFTRECVNNTALGNLLVQYVEHEKGEGLGALTGLGGSGGELRRNVFLVFHRLLSVSANPPKVLVSAEFLRDLCRIYPRSSSLREILQNLWIKNAVVMEAGISTLANSAVKLLQTATPPEQIFDQLIPLIRLSPEAAQIFIAGADFTESLFQNFCEHRSIVVKTTYSLFKSILEAPKPNASLFYDQIYNLIYNEDGILRALLTSTPLLSKLSTNSAGNSRLETLYDSLMTKYAGELDIYTPRAKPSTKDKGKARAQSPAPVPKTHSLQATAPSFQPAAARAQEPEPVVYQPQPSRFKAPPAASQIIAATAQSVKDLEPAPSVLKSTILSLLEEDERDDTYDSVDTSLPGPGSRPASPSAEDTLLYTEWTNNRHVFSREARKSPARQRLIESLGEGWSDERVEGWAVMLERDPRKQSDLSTRSLLEGGRNLNDNVLVGGRYRKGVNESEQFDRGRGGRPRGGRGRGGLGRGGRGDSSSAGAAGPSGTAGPSNHAHTGPDTSTARGRARKEQNKGRVAREGRARKMARGGLPG